MARPKATELTSRELAVMQVFWHQKDATVDDTREHLSNSGEELAHATVANVVRSLADKGFLKQLNEQRPFRFAAIRSFNEVSQRLVGDLVSRVFQGSREAMLVQLLDRRKLTHTEKTFLTSLLAEEEK